MRYIKELACSQKLACSHTHDIDLVLLTVSPPREIKSSEVYTINLHYFGVLPSFNENDLKEALCDSLLCSAHPVPLTLAKAIPSSALRSAEIWLDCECRDSFVLRLLIMLPNELSAMSGRSVGRQQPISADAISAIHQVVTLVFSSRTSRNPGVVPVLCVRR